MSDEPVELPGAPRHFRKGFPSDWLAVRAAGTVVVIHEPGDMGTTAYTIAGTTRNPRVIATAEAVLWCGEVLRPTYEDGIVRLGHPHAGRRASFVVSETWTDAVPVLERTDLVELESEVSRDGDD